MILYTRYEDRAEDHRGTQGTELLQEGHRSVAEGRHVDGDTGLKGKKIPVSVSVNP